MKLWGFECRSLDLANKAEWCCKRHFGECAPGFFPLHLHRSGYKNGFVLHTHGAEGQTWI